MLCHQDLLKKFRLTGTATTMKFLKEEVFLGDKSVQYGPTFCSGPLGGDAEISALMCRNDLGGLLFFVDPLSSHPHQADIDSLIRMANVKNVLMANNPVTAHAVVFSLKEALIQGRKDKISSFFHTMESPSVEQYQKGQNAFLDASIHK